MNDYAELRAALKQKCNDILIEDVDTIRALLAERDALETEGLEQARLNGAGSEREARLMAERDALRNILEGIVRNFDSGGVARLHPVQAKMARAALAQEQGEKHDNQD